MSADAHYDVVIIGTGAGGGTLARRLAPTGLKILLVERGDLLPRERENWDPKAVFADKRYLAAETWYDHNDQPFAPYTHYWVGGNTKVYGAALLRMREHDFGEVRHYGGLSPAWPIAYHDLEPYYTLAERMYSVHGTRGSDPCEPRASSPFPHASLPNEPRMQELFDGISALGYKPFAIPLGVRAGSLGPAEPPTRFSSFDGYPDLTEMKSDAHVCGVRPAMAHANVTLLTRAYVERLATDATGTEVREVHILRDGQRLLVRGDIVVLACGAINSAALLLRSANGKHPKGLANSSGQVGRNYMTHHNGCFIAVTHDLNPSPFQKSFGMTDFYRGEPNNPGSLPLGTIQLMGKPDRWTLEWLRGASPEAEPRLQGMSMDELMTRTVDFFLTAEDLPSPENRVSLREDGTIKISYQPTNPRAYDLLKDRLTSILNDVETRRGKRPPAILHSKLGVSGVSHQNGTLRFGTDPRASVLDVDCQAHDLENLYVADGSFFPSSSAVNPSLTIMANAIRIGDRIARRLSAKVTASQEGVVA